MERSSFTIGILGGMGTYATIHLFRQYAKVFPAEKEWERPRLILDNRCTMPSRVRAALYGENREQLILEISDSVSNLIKCGCDRILLGCNTAHLFLPDLYSRIPPSKERILSIIEVCADALLEENVSETFLLASEGTIESGIYQEACRKRGIRCKTPAKEEYALLRDCIEAVKQDRYPDRIEDVFSNLIHRDRVCVLGCTELPVLYEKYRDRCMDVRVFDPAYLALKQIRKELPPCFGRST